MCIPVGRRSAIFPSRRATADARRGDGRTHVARRKYVISWKQDVPVGDGGLPGNATLAEAQIAIRTLFFV
jgi:hypothetical protein